MDTNAAIIGATAAALVTGVFGMIGYIIQRSTSFNTSRVDDRGKFTRDLMETVEGLKESLAACEDKCKKGDLHEMTMLRIMSKVAAEVRTFADHLVSIEECLDQNPPDLKYAKGRLVLMKTSLRRLNGYLETVDDDVIGSIRHTDNHIVEPFKES